MRTMILEPRNFQSGHLVHLKHAVNLFLEFFIIDFARLFEFIVLRFNNTISATICCRTRYVVGIKDGLVVDQNLSHKLHGSCLWEVKAVIEWELSVRLSIEVHIKSVGLDIVMNFNLQVEVFDVEIHRPKTFSRI